MAPSRRVTEPLIQFKTYRKTDLYIPGSFKNETVGASRKRGSLPPKLPQQCADGPGPLKGEPSPASSNKSAQKLSALKAKGARANLDMVQRKPAPN